MRSATTGCPAGGVERRGPRYGHVARVTRAAPATRPPQPSAVFRTWRRSTATTRWRPERRVAGGNGLAYRMELRQRDGRVAGECAEEWCDVLAVPDFRPEHRVQEDVEADGPVQDLACRGWRKPHSHRQTRDRG